MDYPEIVYTIGPVKYGLHKDSLYELLDWALSHDDDEPYKVLTKAFVPAGYFIGRTEEETVRKNDSFDLDTFASELCSFIAWEIGFDMQDTDVIAKDMVKKWKEAGYA